MVPFGDIGEFDDRWQWLDTEHPGAVYGPTAEGGDECTDLLVAAPHQLSEHLLLWGGMMMLAPFLGFGMMTLVLSTLVGTAFILVVTSMIQRWWSGLVIPLAFAILLSLESNLLVGVACGVTLSIVVLGIRSTAFGPRGNGELHPRVRRRYLIISPVLLIAAALVWGNWLYIFMGLLRVLWIIRYVFGV